MKREAIEKARARFARARLALDRLNQKDGFGGFEAHWTDFLLASNAIYTALEQGSKSSPQSRQWFGLKKKERGGDPLLQYLHHARNADEHGLERMVDRREQTLDIDFKLGYRPKSGWLKMKDGTMFELPPAPENADGMILSVLHFALAPVRDSRFGNVFYPPTVHFGKPLEDGGNPLTVARLALEYQEKLIAEAENLA